MGGQEVFARNPLWQGVPAIWYANLRQFALAYLAVTGGDAGRRERVRIDSVTSLRTLVSQDFGSNLSPAESARFR